MQKATSKFDYRTIISFTKACEKVGVDPSILPDVSMIPKEFRKEVISCYKLFIIFKAINNGWIANFTNPNQLKYFPWLKVNSSGSGFVFADSYCYYGYANSLTGAHLCTDTSEKAIFIGETFGAEYVDFFLNQKTA
jgi:hypothetical protein